MADVNLQLVREFFELNLFRVLTHWQQEPWRQRSADHSPQLFVERAVPPAAASPPPFLLRAADLAAIERAVIEVRAWHADRFYAGVIEANPILWQFTQGPSAAVAREIFGLRPYATILVLSELPNSPEPRARAIGLLEETGLHHVIEFPVILRDLLDRLDPNTNYAASTTLQTLRLLKRYRFIRNQQLEFAFPTDPPTPQGDLRIDTAMPLPFDEDAEDDEAAGEEPHLFPPPQETSE